MYFSKEEFEKIVKKIQDSVDWFQVKLDGVPGLRNTSIDHWWVSDAIESGIEFACSELEKFLEWLIKTFKEIIEGIACPIYMFVKTYEWWTVKHAVTQVQGDVNPDQSKALREWHGSAAVNYKTTDTMQGKAIGQIGSVADKVVTTLATAVAAGATFYAAILAIAEKAQAVVMACIAAIESAIFALAGLAAMASEFAFDTASVAALIGVLTAVLVAQAGQLVALMSAGSDMAQFKDGKWPDPITSSFDNGSRLGGDAPWSLK